jgi:predicted nuclease of predicted toxin-antitoxin system
MDEHIHQGITDGLRQRGVDVLTVQEDGRTGTPDPLILDRATELQRVIFTQDQDFLAEANRRQVEGMSFAGVIYAHQRLVTIGEKHPRLRNNC